MRSKHTNSGFTLVELLVVIAIIALLLSVLLPALNKARDQAKLLVCNNQVRQVMLAELMYSQANRNCLPPINYSQMYALYNITPPPMNNFGYVVWTDALVPYIPQAKKGEADYSLTCPNFKSKHPAITPYGIDGTPYGQNGWMDNDQDGTVNSTKGELVAGDFIRTIKARVHGELLIISESYWHPWSPNKTAWEICGPGNPKNYRMWPELRHKAGYPVGFLDGHVRSYKTKRHPNTDKQPPLGTRPPIYWPDIPDNWWLMR